MAYIISELDELEREEFYRLKKIQDKKKIARGKAEKEKELLKAQGLLDEAKDSANIFDDHHDEDILF